LRMARLWGYSVAEVPVNWMEMPGSKVRLVADSVSMFRRLWEVRKQTARAFAEQSLAGSPTRKRTAEASLPSPHMVAEIAEGFDASGASRG
jgi:dolichyl-phosphate beta-glucosyltransferase